MPSTSKRQANFMKAVANNPKFAKKVGVSRKVGKEFAMADKKKGRYAEGGTTGYPVRLDLDAIKKTRERGENRPARPVTQSDLDRHARRQGEESRSEAMVMKKSKSGSVKKYAAGGLMGGHKSADGIAKKGKTKGRKVAMRRGGSC